MKQSRAEKHISSSETAQMLGISVSSVKNWVRHGFIESIKESSDLMFLEEDVISLRGRILNGELNRLSSRANKSNSSRTFLPNELFKSSAERHAVSEVLSFIMRHNIDTSMALFLLSLNLLENRGMLKGVLYSDIFGMREIRIPDRGNLSSVLMMWRDSIDWCFKPEYSEILMMDFPDHINIAGIIYQSILMEGDRSRIGMYYTPDKVVSEVVERVSAPDYRYLDPCCGTGQFLLAFADRVSNPENIYGIDIDPVAVNVAKINLLMKFPDRDFNPKIFCADSLIDLNESIFLDSANKLTEFDCIATNPPWGSHFTSDEIKKLKYYYPEILSGESYSYFLVKSLRMLKDGGILSFVLPESILNVRMHSDIRKYIIKNYSLKRIEPRKKIFKNVFSPAVIIDIRNGGESGDVEVVDAAEKTTISIRRFAENRDFIFDVAIDVKDEMILSKIYSSPHRTLKGNAKWALGVVTGDNDTYLSEKKTLWNEAVIRGVDIYPFRINPPAAFIKFEPEKFQQCAHQGLYRCSEKLVYRFISNRLVFALDSEERITLNSANILIPELEGVDIKGVMALFNSELYQYIFQKKFSSLKVLKSHIEELPIPVMNRGQVRTLGDISDKISDGESFDLLNNYVYRLFKINRDEVRTIKERVK